MVLPGSLLVMICSRWRVGSDGSLTLGMTMDGVKGVACGLSGDMSRCGWCWDLLEFMWLMRLELSKHGKVVLWSRVYDLVCGVGSGVPVGLLA